MFKNKLFVLLFIGAATAILSHYSKMDEKILIIISGISLLILSIIANIKISKNNLIILLTCGAILYALEILGANTGIVYGQFSYSTMWQPALLGTPVVMLLVWATLVKESFYIVKDFSKNIFLNFVLSGLMLVALDLVIDPGAVHLGLWSWQTNGIWYGIPISNYIGWLVLGTLGGIIIKNYNYNKNSIPIMYTYTLGFWAVYTLLHGMYGASFVGLILILILKNRFNILGRIS